MNHLQTETLIAAWREDADTARKAGHEQTAREIEAAAGLFERQAAEINTLRENNEALQAELDDGHAELREERDEAKRMLASACEYLSRVSVLVGGDG
jgi:chromosome segregation ATPase